MNITKPFIYSFFMASAFLCAKAQTGEQLKPVRISDVSIRGELATRALKNFDRLEAEIYTPERVFADKDASVSPDWPGDYEGRLVLALTQLANATGRTPKYLDEIMKRYPSKLNNAGYLGPMMKDSISEQQLSGHGWLLRGLCDYYEWKKDPAVKGYIRKIVENLVLPTAGFHKTYPINPAEREKNKGAPIGSVEKSLGRWKLSSDIGCNFILLDGIVRAYQLFPSSPLKSVIEEMITRFLQIDLTGINAQTHATLTALRGMLRYYEISGQTRLLDEVEKRYKLYKLNGVTENYENYNWFGRPEWTEPCAIVDSYLIAIQLWRYKNDPLYLEDAHLIYYNAIAHSQRSNGGFGLDNCVRHEDKNLKVFADEAYWCCSMRGAECLSQAISSSYFTTNNQRLVVPFFNTSKAVIRMNKNMTIEQASSYPFFGRVMLTVRDSKIPEQITVSFFAPHWAKDPVITIDNKPVKSFRSNGFISAQVTLKTGARISYTFDMQPKMERVNEGYELRGDYKISYGPLLLGHEGSQTADFSSKEIIRIAPDRWRIGRNTWDLSPVYHLLSPKVRKDANYSKKVLFEEK